MDDFILARGKGPKVRILSSDESDIIHLSPRAISLGSVFVGPDGVRMVLYRNPKKRWYNTCAKYVLKPIKE